MSTPEDRPEPPDQPAWGRQPAGGWGRSAADPDPDATHAVDPALWRGVPLDDPDRTARVDPSAWRAAPPPGPPRPPGRGAPGRRVPAGPQQGDRLPPPGPPPGWAPPQQHAAWAPPEQQHTAWAPPVPQQATWAQQPQPAPWGPAPGQGPGGVQPGAGEVHGHVPPAPAPWGEQAESSPPHSSAAEAPSAPPKRSKAPLVVAGAVVLVAAVVLVLGFVVPGFFLSKVLDAKAVQTGITTILIQDYGLKGAGGVVCPAGIPVKPDTTFTCAATVDGKAVTVPVRITSGTGDYEVGRPS